MSAIGPAVAWMRTVAAAARREGAGSELALLPVMNIGTLGKEP